MLSLPDELVSHIFALCLPIVDSKRGLCPSANSAPLLLVQVSSLWRQIAFGTSELWCSVEKEYQGNQPPTDDPMLVLWLERAQSRPIHLVVQRISQRLLLAIIWRFPNIARLRAGCCSTPGSILSLPFSPGPQSSIQFLDLHEYLLGPINMVLDHPGFALPNLQRLAIRYISTASLQSFLERSALGNALCRLEYWVDGGTRRRDLRRLLRAIPALTHLKLHEECYTFRPGTPLPSLCVFGALLAPGIAPRLEELRLDTRLHEKDYRVLVKVIRERFRPSSSGLATVHVYQHYT
ncbi:hypothetical protein MKEN_00345800 [Mycena kentingensis (nom. inval.)]|nr:hypothetical protein MKEN_00345800 [Mycena kentingensis (nom. inval.)]